MADQENVNASFMPIEKMGVGTWRDGPVGSDAPINAVVLHFDMEAVKLGMGLLESIEEGKDVTFGLRMKSRERVNEVIELLAKHRDEVWAGMTDKSFDQALLENIEKIAGVDAFCSLYSPGMANFKEDPVPAIQLAIAILLDKPIILAVLKGRTPPAKLLAIADEVVYGDPEELARGIKEATERLAL